MRMLKFTYMLLCLSETYTRCRWDVNSFYAYCYIVLAGQFTYHSIGSVCDEYGGLLVWFSEDTEIIWLNTILQAYSINCIHLGKFVCQLGFD